MPIAVVCPSCKAKLNAPDQLLGKKVKCPKCQSPVVVSAPAAADRPEKVKGSPPAGKTKPTTAPKPAAAKGVATKPPAEDVEDDDRPVKRKAAPEQDGEEDGQPEEKPAKTKKKKSAWPMILIGCGVAALGGFVILCVGLPLALYWLTPSEPQRPPGGSIAGGASINPVSLGPKWVPHEDAEFFFKAEFPNAAPTPFDPLAEITDPAQREMVAAFIKAAKTRYLAVTDGGRRYLLEAAPLDIGNTPGRTYLTRAEQGMKALFQAQGYTADAGKDAESAGHSARDYVARKEGKVELMRMVAAPGFVYKLTVEGGADLTPDDATAKGFFDKFASTKPPADGGTKPTKPTKPGK